MTLAGPAVPRPGELETPGIGAGADPSAVVYEMISGYWHTQLLWVAARLGVPDRLADGPSSVGPLARATGTHAPSLARVLRALVAVGVCDHRPDDTYALTELGWALTTDAPGGGRDRALLTGGLFYTLWAGLLDSVRTGETAAETILGMPVFDYFVAHPDLGAVFDRTMAGATVDAARQVLDVYDFSDVGTVVDVGGGTGAFVRTVLDAHPPAGVSFTTSRTSSTGRARTSRTLACPSGARRSAATSSSTSPPAATSTCCPTSSTTGTTPAPRRSWPPAAERWRRTPVSSSSNRRCPHGRRRATR